MGGIGIPKTMNFRGLPPFYPMNQHTFPQSQVTVAMPAIRPVGTAWLQKKIGIDQVANHPIRHQKAAWTRQLSGCRDLWKMGMAKEQMPSPKHY